MPPDAGDKRDAAKLDLTLVPPALEEAAAAALEFGAKKYTRWGWRTVPDAPRRYFAAMERHIKAYKRGEDNDPESGLPHLNHAAACLAIVLGFRDTGDDIGGWRYKDPVTTQNQP
jgi:hypothetical protein